jgi:hypothetical protein
MTSDDFSNDDKIELSAAELKRAQDFDDSQNELAGRDAGRISRFFNDSRRDSIAERQRKNADTVQFLTNLQILMQDPEYAALYKDVTDLLSRAEVATDKALMRAEAALEDILDKAARLPDGGKVFMDKDGQVRSENGAIVDVAIAEGIVWPEDAPSYEDYTRTRQRIDEVREYQVGVLGHARERLSDEENPAQKDELESIQNDIQNGIDVIVNDKTVDAVKPVVESQRISEIDTPNL